MKIWIAVLAVALVVAGCGYRPVSAAPPSTGAAVRLLPADSPTPTDTPSPADSPTPAAEPSPTPSDTPTPTEAPTVAPTAQPTATPPPAPTPTPTPVGYLFTWSGSGTGTSPRVVLSSPVPSTMTDRYLVDLSFSCSGPSPSLQAFEWAGETGSPTGAQTSVYQVASKEIVLDWGPALGSPGVGGRWVHLDASPDCSYSAVIRQKSAPSS